MNIAEVLANGGQIADPRVGRYVLLMGILRPALKTLTQQDHPGYKPYEDWWSENRKTFKVPE